MTRYDPVGAMMRCALLAIAACVGALVPAPARADSITITLDNANLIHFYPNGQDPLLPGYYKAKTGFPQTLQQSIQQFTTASLSRDGIPVDVAVAVTGGTAQVTLSSTNAAALKQAAGYVTMLPAFMNAGHAGLGWTGSLNCQSATGCWDAAPGVSPWAFYLPLGLPLVNQKAVMLLNYPPSDALCSADYLSNFTMARWTSVLQTVGVSDPVLYETIVDVHPIAAPGSGQSGCIAKSTPYFYSQTQPNYDQSLLNLVVAPTGRSTAVPLQVAGSDALAVWGSIIGGKPTPGSVGTFTAPGQPSIPWVATNHPDVTSYQRCPGDAKKPSSPKDTKAGATSCSSATGGSTGYTDDQLVADELMDLQAACVLKALAANPATTPEAALAQCKTVWCTENNGTCQTQAVCIQARMDYDFTSVGNCKCPQAAAAFCSANANNACPSTTSVSSCASYNTLCTNTPPKYSTCKSLSAAAQ
jgi:hypothetical protein